MTPEELENIANQVDDFRTAVDNLISESNKADKRSKIAIGIGGSLFVLSTYLVVKYTIPQYKSHPLIYRN